MYNHPLFILFEGIDGSGKTTQAALLAEALNKRGSAVLLKEPTDAPSGRRIRELLKSENSPDADVLTAMFIQDRAFDVEHNIIPSLNSGRDVVLDRYFYSNAAYQAHDQYQIESILTANTSRGFPEPDIIFFIEIPPSAALERIGLRDSTQCFERSDELERINGNYKMLSDKFVSVDGTMSVEDVHRTVFEYVESFRKARS